MILRRRISRLPGFFKCLLVAAFQAPLYCAAQLKEFTGTVESETNALITIAQSVLDAVFAIGAIGVIWAYVTKRQDARDYLIYYAIAIVIYGIIRTTYFKVS